MTPRRRQSLMGFAFFAVALATNLALWVVIINEREALAAWLVIRGLPIW